MYLKRALFFSAALVILGQCSAQAQTRVRLQANLSLTRLGQQVEALASGKAKYEARANFSKFSCEVEDLVFVNTIAVYRGGTLLGFADVNDQGLADLNLDTRLGHRVPRMAAGNQIRVFDFDTGALIFTGRL